jgi:hypothetical protein
MNRGARRPETSRLYGPQFEGQRRSVLRVARKAETSEGVWEIHRGKPQPKRSRRRIGSVEDLHYNNPYGYKIERVWFDGHVVFATEQGDLEVDPKKIKVAQEYQIVYSARLDRKQKLITAERVRGQFNIYDSIPGMKKYSPIWQFNYVIVPRAYVANALRSERDCLRSGYEIRKSLDFEN